MIDLDLDKMRGTVFIVSVLLMIIVLSIWIDKIGYELKIYWIFRIGIWMTGILFLFGMIWWMIG